MRRLLICLWCTLCLVAFPSVFGSEVRVGVLEFGTVNWELDVIRHHGLAAREGVELRVLPLASKEAASVALQSGAVDVIVSDWLWVSRQRANGADFTFVPHSLAVGGLMVRPGAEIENLAGLAGKRIGVAGGPDDKSWLLLRAYAIDRLDRDIADDAEVSFGAPPLLNALVRRNELDGVLNYWHYNARLSAEGMRKLIDVEDVLPELGIARTPPLLGWTFSNAWARKHRKAIEGFLDASVAAKRVLRQNDAEWHRLRPLMKADSDMVFLGLRDSYREGIPAGYGQQDIAAARRAFDVMVSVAGESLTGGQRELAPGTFWDGYRY